MAEQHPFPIFGLINGETENYMCLWLLKKEIETYSNPEQSEEENDNKVEQEEEEEVEKVEEVVCGVRLSSFELLLDHLDEEHKLTLRSGADFCKNCEVIFESALEGLEHYLTHAISLEGTRAQTHWEASIYENLKEIRFEILNFLLFGRNEKEENSMELFNL